jgi:choline kinase
MTLVEHYSLEAIKNQKTMETLTIPNQAVILAGGFGNRMSEASNPFHCKSLIEIGGQSLLGHLLDSLKEAGIENFVFKANDHCFDRVKAIIESKNLKNWKLVEGVSGFKDTPYFVRDLLHERFFLVCGHHFITSTHLKKMLGASKTATNVISLFSNSQYPLDKDRRIMYENGNFKRITIHDEGLPAEYLYARNPYIVEKNIAYMTHADDFKHTFSYYMYKSWENGISMKGVEADMPPEFDYDHELEAVKKFFNF